jgi:lysophospholipid acyltransferase (LPLAT)-like uncharacterized protein
LKSKLVFEKWTERESTFHAPFALSETFMGFRHYFWTRGEPWNSVRLGLAPQTLRALHSCMMCGVRVTTSGVHQAREYLENKHDGPGAIFPVWHDVMLMPMYLFRDRGIGVIVSPSRSGRIAAALWRLYGWPTTWGSTKGQQGVPALRQGLAVLRSAQNLGFTPDGPLGPYHRAQPGIVYLAAMSGAPIFPLGVAVSRAWRLPTWDHHVIPKPAAHVHLHLGAPIVVSGSATRQDTEIWRIQIEAALNQSTAVAEHAVEKVLSH